MFIIQYMLSFKCSKKLTFKTVLCRAFDFCGSSRVRCEHMCPCQAHSGYLGTLVYWGRYSGFLSLKWNGKMAVGYEKCFNRIIINCYIFISKSISSGLQTLGRYRGVCWRGYLSCPYIYCIHKNSFQNLGRFQLGTIYSPLILF